MKVPQNLNNLIIQVKLGKLTPQEGLNLIAEDIQEFPFLYGLHVYDEEFRSDLILKLLQNGPGFFYRYKAENGVFKTYLNSLIRFQIQDLLRAQKKIKFKEKNIETMSILEYENDQDKYNDDEFSNSFVSFSPYTSKNTDFPPYSKKFSDKIRTQTADNDINVKKQFGKQRKSTKLKKTALVLALKSCYYMTDEHYKSLSQLCGIPYESIEKLVEEVKESTSMRQNKISKIQTARDKAFQLKCMINERLQNEENENAKEFLQRTYEYHTKHWNNTNSLLKEKAFFPSPTNKKVAEVLGLCERQVGYYLQNADKIVTEYINNSSNE